MVRGLGVIEPVGLSYVRHDLRGRGQVTRSKSRLVRTPDDSSDVVCYETTWNGPAVVLVLVTPGAGPGRHTTWTKVPTMAKSTRGFPRSDSETRFSAVKITPVLQIPATVPSTRTVA
jgi:hypothetical protein